MGHSSWKRCYQYNTSNLFFNAELQCTKVSSVVLETVKFLQRIITPLGRYCIFFLVIEQPSPCFLMLCTSHQWFFLIWSSSFVSFNWNKPLFVCVLSQCKLQEMIIIKVRSITGDVHSGSANVFRSTLAWNSNVHMRDPPLFALSELKEHWGCSGRVSADYWLPALVRCQRATSEPLSSCSLLFKGLSLFWITNSPCQ